MISRYDSGWVAATPGVFETAGIVVHPGAVTGAYNIREIRDTAQSFSPGGGGELLFKLDDAAAKIGVHAIDACEGGLCAALTFFETG